jgi:hypoxanthine-guanine phosphoribosyltransferase
MLRLKSEKPPKFRKITKTIVGTARELAEQLSKDKTNRIGKDTLVIYLDKSGRLVSSPLISALKEKGIEVPQMSYFLNYSYKGQAFQGKNGFEIDFQKYIPKELERIGGAKFRNIIIVDEYAFTGRSLYNIKNAFQKLTNKPVATVAFAVNPVEPLGEYHPDFFGKSSEISSIFGNLKRIKKPVRDVSSPPEHLAGKERAAWVRRSISVFPWVEPNKEGMRSFYKYHRKVQKEFKRPIKRAHA